MAKKKSKFMDDGSDTSSNSDKDDSNEFYDQNDQDFSADRELFPNMGNKRGRGKRTRNDEDENEEIGFGGRRAEGKRVDLLRGQAFVSSGTKAGTAEPAVLDNLSTVYSIDGSTTANAEPEEEIEMDLDSDVDSAGSEELEEYQEDEEDEEELVAIPGLAPLEVEIIEPPVKELPFAPRGIGAKGKGGIGARAGIGGGIGSSRGGIGGIGSSTSAGIGSSGKPERANPVFTSATAASNITFGSASAASSSEKKEGESKSSTSEVMDTTDEVTPRAGLGSNTGGGIGSKPKQSLLESLRAAKITENPLPTPPSIPVPRQSFLPAAPSIIKAPLAPMSSAEKQHFAKLSSSNSLGLKMLEKMGWKSGTGLGMNEQGIVTPIGEGTKVRPMKMGLAFEGYGERSSGAKEEGRRRGEEQDEPSDGKGKGKRPVKEKKEKPLWQQTASKKKEIKIKTEYKTYEEIVADQGGEPEGVGILVDLSGNALSDQSLANLPAYGAGTADPTRLPELRHNLTLLTSTITSSLSALAREGKSLAERKNYINKEELRVNKVVSHQERSIQRLKRILAIVARISEREKEVGGFLDGIGEEEISVEDALKGFGADFDELMDDYGDEYEEMRLDEVVVGGIAPILRRLLQNWNPLTDPTFAIEQLKKWRKHFLIDKNLESSDKMDLIYGSANYSNGGSSRKASDRVMTPFETMMWTIWLPRVRSALNNAWSPSDPMPAVALFTAWTSILPSFIRDNILDQLILPKLSKAIGDWSPSTLKRGGVGLHTIVFPWLELTGNERMEIILEEAKRKIRSWLKSWKVRDGVPAGMDLWKDAFSSSDWDALIIKNVLPQLGTTLRDEFTINPRAQELKPLENVLSWRKLLRSSILSQLLETSFFDKWLDALYVWLTHDPNFDQVAEWYSYWKSYFPDEVIALSGVSRGFRKGLDLMNQASALGDDAKYRLKRPDTSVSTTKKSSKSKSSSTIKPTVLEEITFKSIVSEFVSQSNLIFLSTGKAHENHTLFKISKTVDGKSGITIYLHDDVVWMLEKGDWKPIGLEELVVKALK